MAVLNPLKLVLTNFLEGETDEFEAPIIPRPEMGNSPGTDVTPKLYIEQDDFMEDCAEEVLPLEAGWLVRLRNALHHPVATEVIQNEFRPRSYEVCACHCD